MLCDSATFVLNLISRTKPDAVKVSLKRENRQDLQTHVHDRIFPRISKSESHQIKVAEPIKVTEFVNSQNPSWRISVDRKSVRVTRHVLCPPRKENLDEWLVGLSRGNFGISVDESIKFWFGLSGTRKDPHKALLKSHRNIGEALPNLFLYSFLKKQKTKKVRKVIRTKRKIS